MPTRALRLALDQNFSIPLINAVRDYLPTELTLDHVHRIDKRLSGLDDRTLFLALHHLGWNGLITNNHKMLDVPGELAAIIRTQSTVIAVEGLGHDPLRAVGALLLELPGLPQRVAPRRSNVFFLSYRKRQSQDARTFLDAAAGRLKQDPDTLFDEVRVAADEFEAARLPV